MQRTGPPRCNGYSERRLSHNALTAPDTNILITGVTAMKQFSFLILSATLIAASANLHAAYGKEQPIIGEARGGQSSQPLPTVAEGGSERTPGIRQIVEDGSERTPGIRQIAEDGSERTPGMRQIAEDGSDRLRKRNRVA